MSMKYNLPDRFETISKYIWQWTNASEYLPTTLVLIVLNILIGIKQHRIKWLDLQTIKN